MAETRQADRTTDAAATRAVGPTPPAPGIAGLPSVILRSLRTATGLDAQLPLLRPDRQRVGDPALDAFRSTTHTVANFQSSATGIGLFDITYDPATNVAAVTVRVGYDFRQGDELDFEDAKPEELAWTEGEKTAWKTGFARVVTSAWSGQHALRCTKPGWAGVSASVTVAVVEAEKDWHYQLRVSKIPKGGFSGSSVSTRSGLRDRGVNYATLDSEDLEGRNKGGPNPQVGAIHEFGHMLGLDDEYEDADTPIAAIDHAALVKDALGKEIVRKDTDDVMSVGNAVGKQHYVTVLEALKAATGLREWEFAP